MRRAARECPKAVRSVRYAATLAAESPRSTERWSRYVGRSRSRKRETGRGRAGGCPSAFGAVAIGDLWLAGGLRRQPVHDLEDLVILEDVVALFAGAENRVHELGAGLESPGLEPALDVRESAHRADLDDLVAAHHRGRNVGV